MKGLFLTIAGVAAAVSLTVGLNARISVHPLGKRGPESRRRRDRAGPHPRRRTRPHPLSVRKGHARQERLHRPVRRLLAATDHIRQAARNRRSKSVTTRNYEARRRTPTGHLQPSPALHVRQGHKQEPDQRRGGQRLRRQLVRSLSRRSQGRKQQQQRQEQPVAPQHRAATATRAAISRTRGPTATAALSIIRPDSPATTEKGPRP